ncbi:hypothetical protein I6I99_21255 [Sphingobacterium multivorum]|nr:hypothetical protein [Sphingobacterium multivorum]QQT29845.1 hypothetical protein I6I99_21255 [Sphingobacterium multivorum]
MNNIINNNDARQGHEYVNKNQTIKVDLPSKLITQLEEIFPSVNSKTFKKILFIIFLINKGKWNSLTKRYENYYELSIKSLKTYLSLNSKLSPIIKTLLDSNIIAKVGGYTTGVNYQKYKISHPFNFQEAKEELTTLFLTSDDGAYVRKYIADGYIVKYTSITPIAKEQSTDVNNNDAYYQGVIEELIKENKELKKQLEQLRTIKKEELSTGTIEEYLEDDSDIVEEDIEIVKKSRPKVIQDNAVNTPTFHTNDIYATEIIDLINKGIKEFDDIFVAVYSKYFQSLDDEDMKMEVIEMLSNKIEEFIGS